MYSHPMFVSVPPPLVGESCHLRIQDILICSVFDGIGAIVDRYGVVDLWGGGTAQNRASVPPSLRRIVKKKIPSEFSASHTSRADLLSCCSGGFREEGVGAL
ncbi:hypothetical protein E1B28_001622 [Marasmius oreades]|uniref:Uncharacterized protein n=1 Tax=Marasmius oreades TaxID=181124 RepID=A0A9P7V3X1_9AGAR|nr:uncharacterized protein E1B28_001622 [Marasmius oreades]KAG7099811.1 hypothetical protein E1B28_001622 [Marasmius oreades]